MIIILDYNHLAMTEFSIATNQLISLANIDQVKHFYIYNYLKIADFEQSSLIVYKDRDDIYHIIKSKYDIGDENGVTTLDEIKSVI